MSFSFEVESSVPAIRMYRGTTVDWHNLGPKLAPHIVASSIVEGEGGVGSVRQWNFTSGCLKERLDLVDYENLEFTASVIEGFGMGTALKSASIHYKIVPTSSGGSVSKVSGNFEALPGVDASGEAARGEKATWENLKRVEEHLLANPTAYA